MGYSESSYRHFWFWVVFSSKPSTDQSMTFSFLRRKHTLHALRPGASLKRVFVHSTICLAVKSSHKSASRSPSFRTRSPTDDLHPALFALLFNVLEIAHRNSILPRRNQMGCAQSWSSVIAPKRLFGADCVSARDYFFGWN